jgi:AcrR family transcriptional regulator
MGTKERHERDRAAVRNAILQAARDLFVSEGYQNVSMRKIAERIEYSPAAIYSYFASKDEIFFALFEEGFRMLGDVAVVPPDDADPLEALRAALWGYYRFACDQPQYFDLMFVDRSVPQITDLDRFAFLLDIVQRTISIVERCIVKGIFPAHLDAAAVVHVLWAAVHGAATLRLAQRLAPDEDPDRLAADTLEVTLAGLRTGVQLSFSASECHRRAAAALTTASSGVKHHAS